MVKFVLLAPTLIRVIRRRGPAQAGNRVHEVGEVLADVIRVVGGLAASGVICAVVKFVLFAPIPKAKFVLCVPRVPAAEAILLLPFNPMAFAKLVEAMPKTAT